MAAGHQAAIQSFLERPDPHPVALALYLASGLTWLVAAGAAIISLRGDAPAGALALLLLGATLFAVGHPFPPGPVGMTLFIAGLAWIVLSPTSSMQRNPAAATLPEARGMPS
jgi:hypothetical protein